MASYGYRDLAPVMRFAGHTHPDREFIHKYLFEKEGAAALYALRRLGWELQYDAEHPRGAAPPDAAERHEFVGQRCPHWNYMMDKGWLAAIDHFAQCVLSGQAPENASAEDGWRASLLSHAAIRSRETGAVVTMPE